MPRTAGGIREKAAALLQSIVDNCALVDGNKRLGWLATAVFLEINGASVASASNDDVFVLVMSVATGELALQEIAHPAPGRRDRQ